MNGKDACRRAGREARRALSPALREQYAGAICRRVLALPEYRRAALLLTYCPMGAEVSPDGLRARIWEDGKRLAVPVCLDAARMEAAALSPEEALTPGRFGIPEPTARRFLPPEELELILLPCAAFDDHLNRVGMGGGYYDRFLLRCPLAFRVGLAFEAQRVPAVPADGWDVRLDAVVTEAGLYRRE